MLFSIRSVKAIGRTLALIVAFFAAAYPAPGDLDPTFGINGLVVVSFLDRDQASGMVVQPDGKFVVVGTTFGFTYDYGDFLITRFHPNGELDGSFGQRGNVSLDVCGRDFATSVALQPDGKLVVAGSCRTPNGGDFTDRFAVARLTVNGALDTSFGTGGKVITNFFGFFNQANAVIVQPDGRILAAGTATQTSGHDSAGFALARYNPNGSLDNTFGVGGKVITDFTDFRDIADALAIQPDGKIIAGGTAHLGNGYAPGDFALARYNANGSLDQRFGTGGKVMTTVTNGSLVIDHIKGLIIEPDGKIIAGGTATSPFPSSGQFAMARYNPNGTLDTTFGTGGKVSTAFTQASTANAIARQTNGKIILAGSIAGSNYLADIAMARYNSDGSLDATFGNAGQKIENASASGSDAAAAIAIMPNGRIMIAGIFSNRENNSYDFMLARFMGDEADTSEGF